MVFNFLLFTEHFLFVFGYHTLATNLNLAGNLSFIITTIFFKITQFLCGACSVLGGIFFFLANRINYSKNCNIIQ